MGFGRRLPDTYFTEEIVASYLPKRELLCEALRAVGFTLSVPEGAYYIFTQYRGVPALSKMGPCAPLSTPTPHLYRTEDLPDGDAAEDRCACGVRMEAAMFMIEKIGVAPVPGDGFYQEGDFGEQYMRFTFVRSLGLLEEAATKRKRRDDYDEDGELKEGAPSL